MRKYLNKVIIHIDYKYGLHLNTSLFYIVAYLKALLQSGGKVFID